MIRFLIVLVFIVGYLAIMFEHKIGINKTATALLMAAASWSLVTFHKCVQCGDQYISIVLKLFNEHLHDISQIVFFIMGAMTIVALIEAHDGFKIITDFIQTRNQRTLLWVISLLTFFLSSVLDNLTTAIVMMAVVRRFINDQSNLLVFAAMVIIAANAGGAWSPIGDVTTTMLWIGGQLTAGTMMKYLFVPSLVSLLVPLVYFYFFMKKGSVSVLVRETASEIPGAKGVFFLGIGSLVFVSIFRAVTNLPPFMGILLALGIMWILTDLMHRQRGHLRIP